MTRFKEQVTKRREKYYDYNINKVTKLRSQHYRQSPTNYYDAKVSDLNDQKNLTQLDRKT